MKKYLSLLAVSGLLLVACGEADGQETGTEEVESLQQELDNAYARIDELESQLNEVASTEDIEEEDIDESSQNGNGIYEYNELIADNENYTATLLSIESSYDDYWEESTIEVIFDIDNKFSETINVQAREVAFNGRMTDESLFYVSGGEVSPGNSAYVTLVFEDYGSGDLPELEGNFEMQLRLFDWDYNLEAEEYVNVSLD